MHPQSRHEGQVARQVSESSDSSTPTSMQQNISPQSLSAKLRRLSSLPSLKSKKSNSSLSSTSSAHRKNNQHPSGHPLSHKRSTSINEAKKTYRDSAPPPVPVGTSRREMHQSPRQRLGEFSAANGATILAAPRRASPPGHSPQNALKLLQPVDFSRQRQDGRKTNKSGSSQAMHTQTMSAAGEARIDARPSPKGSTNSSDWQSNGTADSNGSSAATDLSEDSRFSTRRLSAWDNRMRSMLAAPADQASLSEEEQALLTKMQKHFSVRGNLGDWDASLLNNSSSSTSSNPADGVGNSDPRFSVRSMSGWDRKVPLNVLAQKVLSNRFSIRPDGDWDSSLGDDSNETTTRTGDYSTIDGDASADGHDVDDDAIKAHFSIRNPEDWDSRVLAAYADRLSVRELDEWDAQIFKKLLSHRFSSRPDGDWDAKIMASAGTSSRGETAPRSHGQATTIRRSRSNTVFSNRRLSAWDAGLVQKIPDISGNDSTSQDASQDDGTRPRAGRRARSGSGFSYRKWNEWDACFDNSSDDISSGIGRSGAGTAVKSAVAADQPSRSSQWLKAAGGGTDPRHQSIFSMRDVDCWDAGLTAHLKDAIQQATTPTFETGAKRLGHVTSNEGLGLSNVGA